MSATVQLIAPLLRPLVAGGLTLMVWVGCGTATTDTRPCGYLVSNYRDSEGRWAW